MAQPGRRRSTKQGPADAAPPPDRSAQPRLPRRAVGCAGSRPLAPRRRCSTSLLPRRLGLAGLGRAGAAAVPGPPAGPAAPLYLAALARRRWRSSCRRCSGCASPTRACTSPGSLLAHLLLALLARSRLALLRRLDRRTRCRWSSPPGRLGRRWSSSATACSAASCRCSPARTSTTCPAASAGTCSATRSTTSCE